ncbi:MAG: hypothetical protein WBE76_08020 [Terracidiphilus sp.]
MIVIVRLTVPVTLEVGVAVRAWGRMVKPLAVNLTVRRVECEAEPAGGLGFSGGGCLLPKSNAQLGGAERGDD